MHLFGQWIEIVLVISAAIIFKLISMRPSTQMSISAGNLNVIGERKYLALAIWVAASLIVSSVWSKEVKAGALDEEMAIKEIIRRTEITMRSALAPTGVLGTKWIQSAAQVKAIRPNAVLTESGKLTETATIFGRQGYVSYQFGKNDMLTLVSFVIPISSAALYEVTQKRLESEYGGMSLPKRDVDFDISSDRTWIKTAFGKVGLTHALITKNSIQMEVIGFYLTFKE